MVWDIDVDSLDWSLESPEKVIEDTLAVLEKKGKGILLMHDIKPATARAMPVLLSSSSAAAFASCMWCRRVVTSRMHRAPRGSRISATDLETHFAVRVEAG
jgi:hypothetical protein